MRRIRHLRLILLPLICLGMLIAWQSPEKVWTTMTVPTYADSPYGLTQHFWRLLDQRQFDLAAELVSGADPETVSNLAQIEERIRQNPWLSVTKVETNNPQADGWMHMSVVWTSQTSEPATYVYLAEIHQDINGGYKIAQLKRMAD
ncbi:MAG: hypothetical protein LBT32_08135 [Peptococcaceae bacterium]|jgi:hypothetical protein|nr:hypothetical protein [Peptococcaceae bacterium]